MILITTLEHGIAAAAHDIVVAARATEKVLAKTLAVVVAEAPVVEQLTTLVDPRAATIERVGAALLGQIVPQLATVAGTVAAEGTAPTVALTAELIAEIRALAGQLTTEIAAAKAALAKP